jgi:hypothetical protein
MCRMLVVGQIETEGIVTCTKSYPGIIDEKKG